MGILPQVKAFSGSLVVHSLLDDRYAAAFAAEELSCTFLLLINPLDTFHKQHHEISNLGGAHFIG